MKIASEKEEQKKLLRQVLLLAVPAILENLLISMVEYVDTAMVGSLGPHATASVASVTPVMWFLNSAIMAVSVGSTVVVAQAIGAKDGAKAKSVSGQSFLLVGSISFILMLFLLLFGRVIPVWMGTEPEVQTSASVYIRILALSMPFHCASMVFYAILRGAGDTRLPMKLNVFTNCLNVIGNFLLIFPCRKIHLFSLSFSIWGAGMGVAGAALSTTLARTIAGILILYVMMRRNDVPLLLKGLRPQLPLLQEILKIGFPTAMERIAISGGQLCYVRIVSSMGTVILAAHQLALTAESISYMPSHGFQIAATTLVGQSSGAKQYQEARRQASMTFRLCAVCLFFVSLILFFGCGPLLRLLTPSAEVVAEGCKALRIIAFIEPFFGMAGVFTGALRGAGDTKQPFFVCFATMWGIRLPMAFLFVQILHWGIAGAWMAMGLDLIFRGLLMSYRFHHGKWEEKHRQLHP